MNTWKLQLCLALCFGLLMVAGTPATLGVLGEGPPAVQPGSDGTIDKEIPTDTITPTIYLPLIQSEPTYARWANAYTSSSAIAIVETGDGHLAVAGRTERYHGWLLKMERDGTIEWQKSHQQGEALTRIEAVREGALIAAGRPYQGGIYVVKHNADGTPAWKKVFGDDRYVTGIDAVGGGCVLSGYRYYGAGWVWKLKSDGTTAWQRQYGTNVHGTNVYRFGSIQKTTDGGYIVAGTTAAFGAGGLDGWVLKLNADGTIAWQKTYGTVDTEYIESIQPTEDGGYIAAGHTLWDGWIVKLKSDGTVDWSRIIGGDGEDRLLSIYQTQGGHYVATGWSKSFGPGYQEGWALRLAQDGTVLWQRVYRWGVFSEVIGANEGGYVIAGWTYTDYDAYDAWVLHLDGAGLIPDCPSIRVSDASIADYAVTVSDSWANTELYTVNSTDSPYDIEDDSAVRTPLCPTGDAGVACETR